MMQILLLYWREILSGIAVLIAMYGYIQYIRSIYIGKTEPHILSWGIWAITTGIAFFAQVAGGGGWGSASNGITFLVCVFVMFLAFKYGKKGKFDTPDYISLGFAFLAIVLWLYTENPFYASLFSMLADLIGYIPTFRKVWNRPGSEPNGYYFLMNIKHTLSLASLSVYSWTTMMFSGSIIIINFLLIVVQFFRKKSH